MPLHTTTASHAQRVELPVMRPQVVSCLSYMTCLVLSCLYPMCRHTLLLDPGSCLEPHKAPDTTQVMGQPREAHSCWGHPSCGNRHCTSSLQESTHSSRLTSRSSRGVRDQQPLPPYLDAAAGLHDLQLGCHLCHTPLGHGVEEHHGGVAHQGSHV